MKNNKALTFIEVMVAISILSLVIGATLATLTTGNSIWGSEMTFIDLQEQVRLAADGMSKELRQSSNANVVMNSASDVTFTIPASTHNIRYYLESGQILREHPAGNNKILANNITSLNFNHTSNSISINIGSQKIYKGRTYSFNMEQKVKFRNE